jgi:hypothetical protein
MKLRLQSKQRANSKGQIAKRIGFAFCCLLSACYGISSLYAQGVLPPKTSTTTAPVEATGRLAIGDKVPETLAVIDENDHNRALLTYKSAVDILVVGFFSSTCPDRVARWGELERFYENYKGWQTAFVAINAGAPESKSDLAKRLVKAGLPVPVLDDTNHQLSERFKVGSVPFLVIIDESGLLRFRGPPGKDARQAIEAVIGHMVPVPNPEPLTPEECSVQ